MEMEDVTAFKTNVCDVLVKFRNETFQTLLNIILQDKAVWNLTFLDTPSVRVIQSSALTDRSIVPHYTRQMILINVSIYTLDVICREFWGRLDKILSQIGNCMIILILRKYLR